MTIEQVLQKAIEGGWNPPYRKEEYEGDSIPINTFLDPQFWQSLGKALGWTARGQQLAMDSKPTWLLEWHRFIDHLAEGKTAEEYFKTLDG